MDFFYELQKKLNGITEGANPFGKKDKDSQPEKKADREKEKAADARHKTKPRKEKAEDVKEAKWDDDEGHDRKDPKHSKWKEDQAEKADYIRDRNRDDAATEKDDDEKKVDETKKKKVEKKDSSSDDSYKKTTHGSQVTKGNVTTHTRSYDEPTDDEDDDEDKDKAPKKAGRPKGKDKGPERVTAKAWKHKGKRVKEGDREQGSGMATSPLQVATDALKALRQLEVAVSDGDDYDLIQLVAAARGYVSSACLRLQKTAMQKQQKNLRNPGGDPSPTGTKVNELTKTPPFKATKLVSKERAAKLNSFNIKTAAEHDADAKKKASVKTGSKMKSLPKKVKEEGTAPVKASNSGAGFTYGKGIYDSLNRQVDALLTEGMVAAQSFVILDTRLIDQISQYPGTEVEDDVVWSTDKSITAKLAAFARSNPQRLKISSSRSETSGPYAKAGAGGWKQTFPDLTEGMSVNISMNQDDSGQPTKSITVTATDEDADQLAQLLNLAGMQGQAPAGCGSCGQSQCACPPQSGCGSCGQEQCACPAPEGQVAVAEVVDNAPENTPAPAGNVSDPEMYAGGLNKPKQMTNPNADRVFNPLAAGGMKDNTLNLGPGAVREDKNDLGMKLYRELQAFKKA